MFATDGTCRRSWSRDQKVGGSNPSGRASGPCSGAIFLALNGASTRRIGHFVARGAPSYRIKINASADPLPAFLPTPALPVAFGRSTAAAGQSPRGPHASAETGRQHDVGVVLADGHRADCGSLAAWT